MMLIEINLYVNQVYSYYTYIDIYKSFFKCVLFYFLSITLNPCLRYYFCKLEFFYDFLPFLVHSFCMGFIISTL